MAADSSNAIFMTQRRRILEAYKAANEPFTASTKPYKSTVSFAFKGATTVLASSVRWIIARQGQILEWFSYKIGDGVPGNNELAQGYRAATEDDTSLSKARTTNGAEDFIIEGMSATNRGQRISYHPGDNGELTGNPAGIDGDVDAALKGIIPIYDPAALYCPPQMQSPFNLENGLYRALSPLVSVEFEWDRQKVLKIGTLEQLPEGAANSYLRASGEPSTNDRYRIPEGYLWRREGQPDSEFIVRGRLNEPLCVPVYSVTIPTNSSPTPATVGIIMLDVVMRLHGLSVKLPSRN